MSTIRRLTVAEQTAALLREDLLSGRWGAKLPGVLRLAAELTVSKDAVRAALRQLEDEGIIQNKGRGKHRQPAAAKPAARGPRNCLRVGLLLSRPLDTENGSSQRMLLRLLHEIEKNGHTGFFAARSQRCLNHSVPRITRMIHDVRADAWVIVDASGELMHWFSTQSLPAIALGGRYSDIPMARVAMDLTHGFLHVVRVLKTLGHRRIVTLVPRVWRLPQPGRLVTALIAELGGVFAAAPDYHFPDWEPTAAGFNTLLESLFLVTPPTAIIVLEPGEAIAVMSFLAQRGLRIPRDVSLVCRHRDASLDLCSPEIAHISSNETHLVHHIVKWVNAAARGNPHRRRIVCLPEFVPAGSLAPPPNK